jgi:hypothetical protein
MVEGDKDVLQQGQTTILLEEAVDTVIIESQVPAIINVRTKDKSDRLKRKKNKARGAGSLIGCLCNVGCSRGCQSLNKLTCFLCTLFNPASSATPLNFHCVAGFWDRTQDRCDFGIGSQTL